MLPTSLASLLVRVLSFATGNLKPQVNTVPPALTFELRHIHAVSSSSATVLFSDVSSPELLQTHALSDPSGSTKTTYSIQTSPTKTYRPSSFVSFSNARLRSLQFGENEWVDWEEDEIMGPNVESRESLLELAKMMNNAYIEPDEPGWYGLNGTWNVVRPFFSDPLFLFLPPIDRFYLSSLILLDGNQKVMVFVATSSPHRTTQQSSFQSRALLQAYSVEVGLRPKKTGLTTIYCSAVAVRALTGHGRLSVDVIEVVGNVTRIAWRQHLMMIACFIQLLRFVFLSLLPTMLMTIHRIYTIT